MKCFLSGYQAVTGDIETQLIRAGVAHRCYSFVYVEKIPGLASATKGFQGAYAASVKNKVEIMMDSGVYSYRMLRDKLLKSGKGLKQLPDTEDFIRLYVDYIKANHKNWGFCMTLDFLPDAKENFIRHKRLLKMGVRPTPVFHGDATIDYVRRYKEELGHDFIGLGGIYRRAYTVSNNAPVMNFSASKYLESMFSAGERYGVKFHGLAVTSASTLCNWPFHSCDSSTWSRQAGYGVLMRFDPVRRRISYVHVSTRAVKNLNVSYKSNKSAVAGLKKEIEAEGFDFEALQSDHVARHLYNAKAMISMAAFATKLHGQGVWKSLYA